MAPKRGGGSGGISFGNTNNRCNDTGNFREPVIISRLTVDGLALAAYLVIFFLWLSEKKRNTILKQILPWFSFGLLLCLSIM